METNVTVNEWTSMFREIGLDEAQMKHWHQVFEARHPAGHQRFLEWLGLPAERIDQIRSASR